MTTRTPQERTVLDALEFTVPCEIPGECSCAATVALSCRRCEVTALLCDRHVAAYRRWFAKTRSHGLIVACKLCRVHMPSFDEGFREVGF